MPRLWVYFFFVVVALILSCVKKQNNPLSFVDSYNPQLLDPKGTVYQGNYFPLSNGLKWKTSGAEGMLTNNHIVITSPQGTIDTTEVDSTYMTLSCSSMTQAQQSISIGGKGFPVTPMSRYTTVSTNGSSDSLASIEYYETTDSAVIIRAYMEQTVTGYDTVTAGNSVFISLPLVAGDRWETTPVFALNTLGAEKNGSMKNFKIHSVTFVIGQDTCSISGATRQTLRLDQVFEVSFTVSDSESNTTVSSTGVSNIYLAKDTGVVKIIQNQNITMKMTMIIQQDTATSNTVAQTTSSEELTSFTSGTAPLLKTVDSPSLVLFQAAQPKGKLSIRSMNEAGRKAMLKAVLLARALLM